MTFVKYVGDINSKEYEQGYSDFMCRKDAKDMTNLIKINTMVFSGSLKNEILGSDRITNEEADWIVEAVRQRLNRQKVNP